MVFFGNLNINEIVNNRNIWKTAEPFSLNKYKTNDNNFLTGKQMKLSMTTQKKCHTFNEFFKNITEGLNLRESTVTINFEK